MPQFNFTKLDQRTRKLMVEEILSAQKSGEIYYSTRFTDLGVQQWPGWLSAAAQNDNEALLAYQIEANGAMKHLETKAKPKGDYTTAHVPDTASETLADGQFNRFYIAAICRRALEDEKSSVLIYRAKDRNAPRTDSINLEGTSRDASALLNEVRNKISSLKCDLLKPNSGLSVDY